MKHSLKHIWITMFSIFAMLMSNYVSSTPVMTMSDMKSQAMTTLDQPTHHAQTRISTETTSTNHHTNPIKTNCHSMSSNTPTVDAGAEASSTMMHCGDSESNVDDCCVSVCSSVSYPIDPSYGVKIVSSSLALHHTFKIGDKVTRIQGLLRPPSA
ncbi:hypothetical protein [Vibrio cortegadensis]|uniref:hypothetical protein n=1 Tax=Vibrio cortegadensis TaxID=1328770 RepID=UPI00352ED44E